MPFLIRQGVTYAGWQGAPGFGNFYYRLTTGAIPDIPAVQSVIDGVRAALTIQRQMEPAAWTATLDATVDIIESTTGVLATQMAGVPGAALAGNTAGNFGPAAAGLVLNLQTASVVNGRVVRGRIFMSPLRAESDAGGDPTANLLTLAANFGDALGPTLANSLEHIVWHRPIAGAGGVACPIVGYAVRDAFSILTSRRA